MARHFESAPGRLMSDPRLQSSFPTSGLVLRQPVLLLALGYALLTFPLIVTITGSLRVGFSDFAIPLAMLIPFMRKGRQPVASYFYCFYLATPFISLLFSVLTGKPRSLDEALYILRSYAIFFPFLLVFYIPNFNGEKARKIVLYAVYGTTIGVLAGAALYAFGIQVREDTQRIWLGNGQVLYRAGGLAGNSGSFGMQLSVWATLLFLIAPHFRIRVPPLYKLFALAVLAYGFYGSSSRGGLLMFLGAVFVYYLLIVVRRPGRFVLIPVILASMAIVMIVALENLGIFDRAVSSAISRIDIFNITGQSRFFQTVRFENWQELPDMLGEAIWLGYGFKQFADNSGFLIDNAYLLAIFETGICGFVFFMLFWLSIGQSAVKLSLTRNVKARLLLVLQFEFMLRMVSGGSNSSWSVAPVVFLLLAVLLRTAQWEISVARQVSDDGARLKSG